MRVTPAIILSAEERKALDQKARARTLLLWMIQVAQLIRMAADGIPTQQIAARLAIYRPAVQL